MQMNTTDLAHRAADLGHAASSIASQVVDSITEHGASAIDTAGRVAGDVGEVIVDAVDRVGRKLPGRSKRRFHAGGLGMVAIGVMVALLWRRRRHRADQAVSNAAGPRAQRVDHAAANGAPRAQVAEERAAGLA